MSQTAPKVKQYSGFIPRFETMMASIDIKKVHPRQISLHTTPASRKTNPSWPTKPSPSTCPSPKYHAVSSLPSPSTPPERLCPQDTSTTPSTSYLFPQHKLTANSTSCNNGDSIPCHNPRAAPSQPALRDSQQQRQQRQRYRWINTIRYPTSTSTNWSRN